MFASNLQNVSILPVCEAYGKEAFFSPITIYTRITTIIRITKKKKSRNFGDWVLHLQNDLQTDQAVALHENQEVRF